MKTISLKNEATNLLNGKYTQQNLQNYTIQDDIVRYTFKTYHQNIKIGEVEAKVKLLNLFYSTGIQATVKMAQHILTLNIDERLEKGDLSIVEEIAKLPLDNDKIRFNYSFATKYCANHYPEKYPIYDYLVATLFGNLFANQKLLPYYKCTKKQTDKQNNSYTKSMFLNKLRDYKFYVDVYKAFMKKYDLEHLSFREVDSYLWSAIKLDHEFTIETLAK